MRIPIEFLCGDVYSPVEMRTLRAGGDRIQATVAITGMEGRAPATAGTLMSPRMAVVNLRATSKPQLLVELAALAMPFVNIDHMKILRALLDREAAASTGLGMGVAMPCIRFRALRRPFALFSRLGRPIDYQALDGRPVDLVLLLLGPEPASEYYSDVLVSACRALRDHDIRDRLRADGDPQSIFAALGRGNLKQAGLQSSALPLRRP